MEEALFEVSPYRDFAGLGRAERIPDCVSILRFRHLLEVHDLAQQILGAVNATLASKGLMLKSGTVVDATWAKQWYFGMKARAGVDADSGLVHSVVGTAANERRHSGQPTGAWRRDRCLR